MVSNIQGTSVNIHAFRRSWLAISALAAIAAAASILALTTPAEGYGYSYMHLVIGGQPVTNFVHDSKYQGWLQVEVVRATLAVAIKKAAGAKPSNDKVEKIQKAEEEWVPLPQILVSGRAGAGKLRFDANDEMINDERESSLSPLIVVQKQKTVIDSAELDLYNEDGGAYIGKYRLKGIRVLSLEDVPASACAMSEVTISFKSAEKI